MPAGRPNEVTTKKGEFAPPILHKLEDAFLMGFTNIQACHWANISQETFYSVVKQHPEYSERFETLRNSPKLKAIKNITDSIKEGDVDNSKWYLERKAKEEFAPRTEVTGPEGVPLGYVYTSDKQLEKKPDALQITAPQEVEEISNETPQT